MIIDEKVKKETEEELQRLVIEVENDQEILHNILRSIGANRMKYCISDATMKEIAKQMNYEFTGPDVWVDDGKKIKVLAFFQEKGNFYKKLGLCYFGCIIQVGELMTIEKR